MRRKQKNPQKSHGIDLTLWAPKSVSLCCLMGGDNRLEEAHRQAVRRTMDFVEQHYAGAKVEGRWVQTDNLVVLMQEHSISRQLDPELHTHCLVLNLTQLPDERWRDLSYARIYQNHKSLGKQYHKDLAEECQTLGYQIEPDKREFFQLRGYSREQLLAFSKGKHKSCNRVPPNVMYDHWRQHVEAGGLTTSIDDTKNADAS